MGVLPIVIDTATPLSIGPLDRIEVDATAVTPRSKISVTIQHADGNCMCLVGTAAVQPQREVQVLQAGNMIQAILSEKF